MSIFLCPFPQYVAVTNSSAAMVCVFPNNFWVMVKMTAEIVVMKILVYVRFNLLPVRLYL